MNNEKLLKKITDWLDSDQSDIEGGALLLLQLNRNKILHRNIVAKRNVDKLRYELQKQREIYAGRSNFGEYVDLTEGEKEALRAKAVGAMRSMVDKPQRDSKGKRDDHELLSADIQQTYERNCEIYPRMRSVHERLKLMDTDCDRYPFVKELIDLDAELRQNWDLYDQAVALSKEAKEAEQAEKANVQANPTDANKTPLTAQKVSNARGYLSRNKEKLSQLKNEANQTGYNALLAKMQERLTILLTDGQNMDAEHLQELVELGLVATT